MRKISGSTPVDAFSIDIQPPEHDVPLTVNFDSHNPIGTARVERAENGDLTFVATITNDELAKRLLGFPCVGLSVRANDSQDPKTGTVWGIATTPFHPEVEQPFWREVTDDES